MLRNFTNLQRICLLNPIRSTIQNTIKCNSALVLKIHSSNYNSASKISNITHDLQGVVSKKFQHTKPHEDTKLVPENDFNSFTYRTHTCGELRPENDGQKVTLCGWVQFVRLSKFILLRDAYGITQCIAGSQDIDLSNIPLETVVKIEGTVVTRPKKMVNSKMTTGEIEVVIDKLDVLNTADKVPFNLRDYQKPKEQLRLQHRYIDLRFPEMQSNLRLRSNMLHNMRRFLVENHGFVEVETPTLFCRTPGGAREFVVPTRHSGLFYSLVQSPQQFKQMLMSGGIDRYYQIARCYRDETTRPDRQPEFTQLDLEMSFTNQDSVLTLIENLLYDTFPKDLPQPPFKRLTYKDAIENYGTDRPNLSYDLKLLNIKKFFPDKEYEAYILPFPAELKELPTDFLQQVIDLTVKYVANIILPDKLRKEFGTFFLERITEMIGEENTFIVCLGRGDTANLCLGELRESLAKILKEKNLIKVDKNHHPLWVVDFPLFTKGENGLETCHHPFTAPHPNDIHLLESEPLKMRSLAYDLVLNGNEIGGGSVRIHNVELQEKILTLLNIEKDSLSHFLNALKHGCPPHAGIALGIDRLTSCICNAESIRDVIAFPKSHDGKDPLSGAPNKISDNDKKYYHISTVK